MEAEEFARRVRCAAVACWWTVLIAAVWLTVAWLAWLLILPNTALMKSMAALWGGVDPASMPQMVVIFFGAFKGIVLVVVLAAIFLSIWARKLRNTA